MGMNNASIARFSSSENARAFMETYNVQGFVDANGMHRDGRYRIVCHLPDGQIALANIDGETCTICEDW